MCVLYSHSTYTNIHISCFAKASTHTHMYGAHLTYIQASNVETDYFNAKNSVVATREFIVVHFLLETLFFLCLTRFVFYLIAIRLDTRIQHIDFSVNK